MRPDPRADGHAQFGELLAADADGARRAGERPRRARRALHDRRQRRSPAEPDRSLPRRADERGADPAEHGGLQRAAAERRALLLGVQLPGTNWIHPLYELPFTGGLPGSFENGDVGALQSIVPGPGPSGASELAGRVRRQPQPAARSGPLRRPRGGGGAEGKEEPNEQREFRERFIPSGLANEIFLDAYERLASFEPGVDVPGSGCSTRTPPRSRASTPTATASSPRSKATPTTARTASRTTSGCSCRRPRSTASR